MAASNTQGMLVAPNTKMPSLLFPTPTEPESFSQHEDIPVSQVWFCMSFTWVWASDRELTLHLDQELGLYAAGSLALVLVPGAAQRVHLVDEDDRGFVLASQVKQILHQPARQREGGQNETERQETVHMDEE